MDSQQKLIFSTKKQEGSKILADSLLDFFRFIVIILHYKRKLGSERLNIQMDNSQTVRDNITLTHNFYSNESRNPNHSLHSNQPRTLRIWLMTASFLIFCPGFQLRTNHRKINVLYKPIRQETPLNCPLASCGASNFQSGHSWAVLVFQYKIFLFS